MIKVSAELVSSEASHWLVNDHLGHVSIHGLPSIYVQISFSLWKPVTLGCAHRNELI